MKYRITILATLLIGSSANALNIRDALVSAYTNNQELLALRQEVIANHEKIVQAKSGFRPKIEANAHQNITKSKQKSKQNPDTTKYYSGLDKNTSGGVTVKQNIFSGFSDVAKVSKAEHEIAGMWAALKDKEQDIFSKVIKAYLELYKHYASVEVYKANLVSMQKAYEVASTKRKIGEETRTQESLAEAKCADAESRLQTGTAELETAKAAFEQLTSLPAPERVDHPKELVDVPGSADILQTSALEKSPKIRQAVENISAAKQGKKEATGALLPSIDLAAGTSKAVNKNKSDLSDISSRNDPSNTKYEGHVGLQLTVPIYDGGNSWSKRRQATETVVAQRITLEKVRQEIIQSCKQAYMSYLATKMNMQNSAKQVKAQEIAVDGTNQEMQVGTKILLDVLNAQHQLLEAKLNQINTIYQYYANMYQMLSLQGKLTAEDLELPVEIFRPEKNYEDIKNHI